MVKLWRMIKFHRSFDNCNFLVPIRSQCVAWGVTLAATGILDSTVHINVVNWNHLWDLDHWRWVETSLPMYVVIPRKENRVLMLVRIVRPAQMLTLPVSLDMLDIASNVTKH